MTTERPEYKLSQISSNFVFIVPRKDDRTEADINDILQDVEKGINGSDKPLNIPYEDLNIMFGPRDDDTEYMVVEGAMKIPEQLDS
jgi:hypothetical protein